MSQAHTAFFAHAPQGTGTHRTVPTAGPLAVRRDAQGRFHALHQGEALPSAPADTPRQACEREARQLRQAAINQALAAAAAAVRRWAGALRQVRP